ncbi:MAG TPA: hypothetical protein VM142_13540 [Acidimicrobiales bacterium]|nr:hypothetical protein [Acidimicrobiales bacterium]
MTANTGDFPSKPLGELGVTVLRPDDYLCGLLEAYADGVVGDVAEMAADRSNPPMTSGEVLDTLERAGVGRFAAAARAYLVP